MAETRRSSSSYKRPLNSPLSSSKRSKASSMTSSSTDGKSNSGPKASNDQLGSESRDPEVRTTHLPCLWSPEPSDWVSLEKTPTIQLEDFPVNGDEEEDQPATVTHKRTKERSALKVTAWRQLISQSSKMEKEDEVHGFRKLVLKLLKRKCKEVKNPYRKLSQDKRILPSTALIKSPTQQGFDTIMWWK